MRTGCRSVWLAAVVALATGPAVSAHHSVSGQFDVSKNVALTGIITKVDWLNPHVYVFLDVKAQDGTVTTWALETLPTAMLRKAGLSKESVAGKPGDVVTVTGNPGRDSSRRSAWIHRITYPDGRYYQLAN
jgi:DNA/RNA endonuclease YhcR with UshA esterase domain